MHPVAAGVVKLALLRLPVVVLAGLGALGFAVGVLAGRSGNAPPAPPPLSSSPSPELSSSPSPHIDPPSFVNTPSITFEDLERTLVPGCTPVDYQARRRELEELDDLAMSHQDGDDISSVVAKLRLTIERPCLSQVAAAVTFPSDLSRVRRHALLKFLYELRPAMELRTDGKGLLAYIPPEIEVALDEAARSRLAPFKCADFQGECRAAGLYSARAYEHFAAAHGLAENGLLENAFNSSFYKGRRRPLTASVCSGSLPATSFDSWLACVASKIPGEANPRLERGANERYRPLSRGWLFLHSVNSVSRDGLAAYDLATGAAYTAYRPGSCEGRSEVYARTGQVSVEALRELATALIAGAALDTRRTKGYLARIPVGVSLAVAPGGQKTEPEPEERQFPGYVTFRYFDGPLQFEGSFRRSWRAADYHLETLFNIVEASFREGCAFASLPPSPQLTFQELRPYTSYRDIDHLSPDVWNRDRADEEGLSKKLEALRGHPCAKSDDEEADAEPHE